jgi:hypothetical protein
MDASEVGARIANGRGVPGTLGAFATSTHDGAIVLLSNQHVVFGARGGGGQPVWLVPAFVRLGALDTAGSARSCIVAGRWCSRPTAARFHGRSHRWMFT